MAITARTPPRYLAFTDRWFRGFGVGALAALATTAALLAAQVDAWRVPFVAAHLAALVALIPLAIALVTHATLEARGVHGSLLASLGAVPRRHPTTSLLVALVLFAAVISISQFTGVRAIRATANLIAVALILSLVVRYLRWFGRGYPDLHS